MYQGVVNHLGYFAWSPTWLFSKQQLALATGPSSAEGGQSRTQQATVQNVPLLAPRGGPQPRGAFLPGAALVDAAAQVQVQSTPADGAVPPDDTGPGVDQPIAVVQWPLWVYCYTCNFTLDRKETAYSIKNGHCLSCMNGVSSLWPDCPFQNHSARQNQRVLPCTDQPASVDT